MPAAALAMVFVLQCACGAAPGVAGAGELSSTPARKPALCDHEVSVTDLGVGHLRPRELLPDWGVEWLVGVEVPLSSHPGGEAWGRLTHGWLVRAGADSPAPVPLDGCASIETDYETRTFIVLERGPEDWFRFRFAKGEAGTGWTREAYLDGEIPLRVEPWEAIFEDEERSPFHFSDREQRHALRDAPDPEGELVAWIGGDHDIDPLERRGDWLRVRVTEPSVFCETVPADQAQRYEGWIRWRDESGLLLWFLTRGC